MLKSGKNLIVFGKYPGQHIYLDKLLLKASGIPPSSTDHYGCPGLLPYCPALDVALPSLSFTNITEIIKRLLTRTFLRPYTCFKCRYQFSSSFPEFIKFPIIYPTLSVIGAYIFALRLYMSRKLFESSLRQSISDQSISCFLVQSRMELNDISRTISLCLFLATCRYHKNNAQRLIKSNKYKSILMFNGRMLPFRIFLNRATVLDDDTKVICHERGFEHSSFTIKSGEPAHKRELLFSLLQRNQYLLTRTTTPFQLTWTREFYNKRVVGDNSDCILPTYVPGNVSSIYQTDSPLVVFYLTTPDEIDPGSAEFELVEKQWTLLPRICYLLTQTNELLNARIVLRLHPNFFTRQSAHLANLRLKLQQLEDQIPTNLQVYIDKSPHLSSPFDIYKLSTLTVTFASSAALESQYFGTPSLVPSSHIYTYGCSFAYDFTQLLGPSWKDIADKGFTPNLDYNKTDCFNRLVNFSYLWFYREKYHFNTLKSNSFFELKNNSLFEENSADFLYLKDHFYTSPHDFLLGKLLSTGEK